MEMCVDAVKEVLEARCLIYVNVLVIANNWNDDAICYSWGSLALDMAL